MRKDLIILGSTGSVGTSALNLVRAHPERFKIRGIAANSSFEEILALYQEFHPEFVHLMQEEAYHKLKGCIPSQNLSCGMSALLDYLKGCSGQVVLAAMVGNIGLLPVLTALEAGATVALANKETLVAGGQLVNQVLEKQPQARLIPVDSEHSAIFQCLMGSKPSEVSKILLTASGGSLLRRDLNTLEAVTPKEALNHPNWDMGAKITVDSSTMMNKGLEVIEAHHLFKVEMDTIEVVVHPQSIVHSLVEFQDQSVMAHLGVPDMTLPINYALSFPERLALPGFPRLNLAQVSPLTFEKPDFMRFPCLKIAFEVGKEGGTLPAVLNAANEVAVQAFLEEKIGFMDISRIALDTVERHNKISSPDLNSILDADQWARKQAYLWLKK
jgi:1-deoxy-D-xylulose-5-phosphate reductoisomerase